MARDCAQHNAGGSGTFAVRTDDPIIMADYQLGLFQIENVLTAYPAVAIAAGVAVPDRLWGGTHHAD